ncbi:MupG family TIM beta-alpha barrel fold protein [Aerococcaceae bacterium NML190938]|nr:MupG family TIM beta-alpha barrel fold protein [Aerococcaceae bacterium NML190938]
MRRLGISIYPEKSTVEEMKSYIDMAAQKGFSRIFSCLLSVNKDKSAIKEEFIEVNQYAKAKGFEIIVDVSPKVFKELDISYQDLSFFKEIGADGLRLDQGFSGLEESLMTFNEHQLKIELNMSLDTHYLDTIMDYQPNPYNLIGCHNFYPHKYSGLGMDFFAKCTQRFKNYGLRTAAFICAQGGDAFGPWPVTEGLPTLEMHRHLPLHIQAKHLIALGNIDDIIISNCYPTEQELTKVSAIRKDMVSFQVELVEHIPEIEKSIVLDELHFNRGDVSGNFIRSTQSRVKYKGHRFDVFHAPPIIQKGDILIESSEYGHYAGELQIALTTMENSGKTNVVGKIVAEEHFILDAIKPWQKFNLIEG